MVTENTRYSGHCLRVPPQECDVGGGGVRTHSLGLVSALQKHTHRSLATTERRANLNSVLDEAGLFIE